MISKESTQEYREIYKKEFNKDISLEEASEQADNLVNFFKLLLEIDRRNKQNKEN